MQHTTTTLVPKTRTTTTTTTTTAATDDEPDVESIGITEVVTIVINDPTD